MSNNFITNSAENATLKKRLEKLILASQELKFLVGFFYFSGWQEIYKKLQDNPAVSLKILVGLQVDKYLSTIVEVGLQDDSLSQEEHFTQFMKSMGFAINNAEMDNEAFYNQIAFFIQLLKEGRLNIRKTLNPNHAKVYIFQLDNQYQDLFNVKDEISKLAVQALKDIGKDKATPVELEKIQNLFLKEDKQILKHDIALAPQWIAEIMAKAL